MAKEIRGKKKCCSSSPRCKRCPVALRRLERAGAAKRVGKRKWRLKRRPSKKERRLAFR